MKKIFSCFFSFLLFTCCLFAKPASADSKSIAHGSEERKYRIGVGGIQHESNMFNPYKITLRDFAEDHLVTGEKIIAKFRYEENITGGAVQELLAHSDVEIVPLLCASATPGGVVTDEAYNQLLNDLIATIKSAGKLDGIVLANHGAMLTESIHDADGYLLEKVRNSIGQHIPLSVGLDFHANISNKVFKNANIVVAYKRYPHIDRKETGRKAAELLYRMVAGEIQPRMAYIKLPMMPGLLKQLTEQEPMKSLNDLLYATEKEHGILSCSLTGGFPYADVPQASTTVVVIANQDSLLAVSRAKRIADIYWARHREFKNDLLSAEDAVAAATHEKSAPVILVDTGDNIAGGTPGDGTLLLRLLYERKMAGLVIIYDPEAVKACFKTGVGNDLSVPLGGKLLTEQGGPVHVEGRVRMLFEGRYFRTGAPEHNLQETIRPMALIAANQLKIILTSNRLVPGPLFQLRAMGITPEEEKLIVVKAAVAWREFYEPIARKIYLVATPGYTSLDYKRFVFHNLTRPLYPFDEDVKWP